MTLAVAVQRGRGSTACLDEYWPHAPAEERRSFTTTRAECSAGQRVFVPAFAGEVDRAGRVAADQALCEVRGGCQRSLPAGAYEVSRGVRPGYSDLRRCDVERCDLGGGLVLRGEAQLSWADFRYYDRRLHAGVAVAHQR